MSLYHSLQGNSILQDMVRYYHYQPGSRSTRGKRYTGWYYYNRFQGHMYQLDMALDQSHQDSSTLLDKAS